MKIVVAVRCRNEINNIDRFLRGYSFADRIIISDGGSTDGTLRVLALVKKQAHLTVLYFNQIETINGHTWNPDAPHMNFVLDAAKAEKPDWIIFDDMDCVPNATLRENARGALEASDKTQVNVFRLYLWGDDKYFPQMNRNFHLDYMSLWAWRPSEIDIRADESVRHGTLLGLTPDFCRIMPPACLLHKSYGPDTIDNKLERYNALGLPMNHPLETNGALLDLPEWAYE